MSQSLSCSDSGGFIYCVGGFNSADVSSNEVCYAQLGASGSTASAASQTPTCFKLSSTGTTTTQTTQPSGSSSGSTNLLGVAAIVVIVLLALLLLLFLRRRKKKPEAANQQVGGQ